MQSICTHSMQRNKNRLHIRNYARNWSQTILKQKQSVYNEVVMAMSPNVLPCLPSHNHTHSSKCTLKKSVEGSDVPKYVPMESHFMRTNSIYASQTPILHAFGQIITPIHDDHNKYQQSVFNQTVSAYSMPSSFPFSSQTTESVHCSDFMLPDLNLSHNVFTTQTPSICSSNIVDSKFFLPNLLC